MSAVKVSIYIPAFNAEKTIKKTINVEQNDQSNIENLLKKTADEQENGSSQSSSSIENSILKKIK